MSAAVMVAAGCKSSFVKVRPFVERGWLDFHRATEEGGHPISKESSDAPR